MCNQFEFKLVWVVSEIREPPRVFLAVILCSWSFRQGFYLYLMLSIFQVTHDTSLGELSRLLDSDHFVIVVLKQRVCKFHYYMWCVTRAFILRGGRVQMFWIGSSPLDVFSAC